MLQLENSLTCSAIHKRNVQYVSCLHQSEQLN